MFCANNINQHQLHIYTPPIELKKYLGPCGPFLAPCVKAKMKHYISHTTSKHKMCLTKTPWYWKENQQSFDNFIQELFPES